MNNFEVVLVGVGLAMDAFAVAVCKGLSMKKMSWKNAVIIGSYFGFFQAIMPIVGYLLGITFSATVEKVDHWIAFVLLGTIGVNMIKEALSGGVEEKNDKVDVKTMIMLAIATSIDALAVGITFAFLNTNLWQPVIVIGTITLILAVLGVKIGNKFGDKFQNKAELAGGVILIIIGVKILLEHLSPILL